MEMMILSTTSSSSSSFHHLRRAVSTTSRRPSAHRPISVSATATAPPPTLTSTSSFSTSHYDVLGLSAAATREEIKAAYRRLARSCHPDVAGDRSADQFLRVRDAYVTLYDPHSRADYDRWSSASGPLRRTATPRYRAASTRYRTTRTWETDQCW